MKFWQFLAFISGLIIAITMALASISYNATLGSQDVAFSWLPLTNSTLFASLALAFDLGMIASVFGFWHWRGSNRIAAVFCAFLFIISSGFSIHSVRGYIALNLTKAEAPVEREQDLYASLKAELKDAQTHLGSLRADLHKTKGRKRRGRIHEIKELLSRIEKTRAQLAAAKAIHHVSPLKGIEWYLAITLWFFHATCWTAWFGTNGRPLIENSPQNQAKQSHIQIETFDHGGVMAWMQHYQQAEPEHCVMLFENYQAWCQDNELYPLSERKFYARLIELGARKFRDGRNGPMKYELTNTLTNRV